MAWLAMPRAAMTQDELVARGEPRSVCPSLSQPTEAGAVASSFLSRDRATPLLADAPSGGDAGFQVQELLKGDASDEESASLCAPHGLSAASEPVKFDLLPILFWHERNEPGESGGIRDFLSRGLPPGDAIDSARYVSLSEGPIGPWSAVPGPGAGACPPLSELSASREDGVADAVPSAWTDEVARSVHRHPISFSVRAGGALAPQGTMYIWRVDPASRDEIDTARGTAQRASAGVVLTRPPGDYSLDWVGVAVSGTLFRR